MDIISQKLFFQPGVHDALADQHMTFTLMEKTENPIIFKTQEGTFDLTASVMKVGKDAVVVIWGGEKPHIGAVALAQSRASLKNPDKISATASVLGILGHKEDSLVKSVSERLAAVANRPVVVAAGMHWDNLQESDLQQVLKNVEILTKMIEPYLRPSGG
jgi:hypothetical protein